MNQMKVLVAEDEEGILEIVTFILESSWNCKVFPALDGQDAISQLNQQEFDLVVCDYNMPNKNGGAVYQHILNKKLPCKYVLCSSDQPTMHKEFNDRSSFFGFVEKPAIAKGLKVVFEKLKEEHEFFKPADIYAYSPIGIKLLLSLSVMPSDVFIKISEDKYIKVFSKGSIFDETDCIKFENKGITKLYVMNVSTAQFVELIQEKIKDISLKETSENKLDSAMQVHNIFVGSFKEYGFNPALIPVIEKHFQGTMAICKTNKSLNLLMSKLLKNKNSYLTKHSFLLAQVAITLASKMEWVSDPTSQKLVISSLFHDIYLPTNISNEVEWLSKNENSEDFKLHSQKASDLLDLMPGIPPDTSRIILEHHEVGEGLGFPRGLTLANTTPLSQLFIFSHYIVDVILEMHAKGQVNEGEICQKLETISKKTPKFGKFFSVLKETGLFT